MFYFRKSMKLISVKDKIGAKITMTSTNTWRGVPLTEIYGSQSPWEAPEFPFVAPSYNHAVLYHVPNNGSTLGDRPPKPQIGHDKWDHDFVRMPCSSQSLYPVEDGKGETRLMRRWEIIENSLSKPIRTSNELAAAILSYNTKFKTAWKFRALHKLFNEYLEEDESQYFFDVTLPDIAKLALALPKLVQLPIPLLKQHKNRSLSLSQQQISSLLANAFFCTFPRRNSFKKSSEYASYPNINFNSLYEGSGDSILEKLKCICHYFRRVTTKAPLGVVTFSRRSVPPRSCPAWSTSTVPVASLPLHVDSVPTIEDAYGLIQIDFANKYLGGGVIGHGCVQEEIRFVICPELMISMLFTEVLRPNEAVMIIGCERYSNYSGYGSTFHWTGDHVDSTPHDSSGRRRCSVLAIDALPYSSLGQEYRRDMITRELNKAWIGVSFDAEDQSDHLHFPGVATGNWGCGAFGGSPELKSLIQMMACTQARRPMAYYTFKDVELRDEIVNIYNLLARYNITVGQLYKYIIRFSLTDVVRSQLNAFLHQVIMDEEQNKTIKMSPKRVVEQMDTNELSEVLESSQNELPMYLQNEFLNNSPDLFSQEDDQNLAEVKVEPNKQTDTNNKDAHDKAESDDSDHVTVVEELQEVTNNTSRLFEEMNKIDSASGKLNLSDRLTSPLSLSRSGLNNSDVATDNEKCDPKSELKKKISRKITYYFNKK